MIHPGFREPNYRCEVFRSNDPTKTVKLLEYGESQQEVRTRLTALGYEIKSVGPYDFTDWKQRARAATQAAVDDHDNGREIQFNSALWSEIKSLLFRIFGNRCAYCEAVVRDVSPGDVEHYRPKGRVEEDPGHPGYYWLAYEVTNWFPACPNCNQISKRARFPIKGRRASKPSDDLALEQPLLLNPYEADPAAHFTFRMAPNGPVCEVEGLTDEGKSSIDICSLNRAELKMLRGSEWIRATTDYLTLVLITSSYVEARRQFVSRLENREFAATCIAALDAYDARIVGR
jgi:hypothetical protein